MAFRHKIVVILIMIGGLQFGYLGDQSLMDNSDDTDEINLLNISEIYGDQFVNEFSAIINLSFEIPKRIHDNDILLHSI